MEWIVAKTWLKKYRNLLLIALLGIAFLLLPDGKQIPEEPAPAKPEAAALEDSLEAVLCQISGAGKVTVLLSQAYGEETLYQIDERITQDSAQKDTVMLSGNSREESGLVRQVRAPVYQGAVVVCQGADRAQVKLAIVEAVKSATGLGSDRITVLKMK